MLTLNVRKVAFLTSRGWHGADDEAGRLPIGSDESGGACDVRKVAILTSAWATSGSPHGRDAFGRARAGGPVPDRYE